MLEAATAQAVGSAVQPVAQAGTGVYQFFKHKYNYVKKLDSNFSMLLTEKDHLCAKENDVNRVIERSEVLMEKTHVCADWLAKVKTIKDEVDNLEKRYNDVRKCLCGLCPFPRLLKLSKDIVNKTNDVVNLMNQMDLKNVVMEKRPATVEHKHVRKIDDVPSLYENVEKLLKYLKDKSIRRIGIWGAAGVGKTTIMENLNDEVEKTGMFDIVIWVTVAKDGSMKKLHQLLTERLKLRVEDINNNHRVATMISTALEGKKYLLLLDEVFADINLRGMGVHDSHEHGKVVVASRSRVICNDMDVDEEINVKRLSKTDAWDLFREIVGDVVDHPRITPVAKLVLKECGQLPQLIKAVGKNLKNVHNESLWYNKLMRLRSPSRSRLQEKEEAFNAFKLAYDDLTGEDRKNCLLYGALFPEDHDIYQDYLMECWTAEQFILDVHSLKRAREEGHEILKDLINTSLFERCKNVEYVKMPMLFRGMALRIIHPNGVDCSLLVKSGEDVMIHPPVKEWTNARRISLMCNKLQTLPDRPECCTSSTLLLQGNATLVAIPDSFFAYMCGLRVLDLHKTKIESLPLSISNLINLRCLYLNDCSQIVELPIGIAELKNLEVLDIRGTGIHCLPIVIGELVGLRCLRVSFVEIVGNNNHVDARQRIMIPPNIVGKLYQLEELTIDVDPSEKSWNEIVHNVAKEVASLETLTTLHFYFPMLDCFEAFIQKRESWNNSKSCMSFRSFRLLVGSHGIRHAYGFDISGNFSEAHLSFFGGEGFPAAILKILDRVITFELISHRTIKSLSEFGMDRIRGLKVCIVNECNEMGSIINSNTSAGVAFPYLEQLHISNLPQLEHIQEGPLESGSFAKLTTLQLYGCPGLRNIISIGMSKHLIKLQVLRVENCSQLRNIIEEDGNQSLGLPGLKILELVSLPTLVSIYPNESLEIRSCDELKSLEILEIRSCVKLKNLPLSIENASNLKRIECKEDWWKALVWQSDNVKDSLQNLCEFIPETCP